jgi:hypothetical protein
MELTFIVTLSGYALLISFTIHLTGFKNVLALEGVTLSSEDIVKVQYCLARVF